MLAPKFSRQVTFALSACVLALTLLANGQQTQPAANLIHQFKENRVFQQQFEVAEKLVELRDKTVLESLEPFLRDEDRHVRGNAAFIFAGLGDGRGFEVIRAILADRSSDRAEGQGIPWGRWSLYGQIAADRYYAVHLFGDLKDARAVPILIPLLKDADVNWIVPWSLGEIGDRTAVAPLIETLGDRSPDMRVLSIYALERLKAKEALPRLQLMIGDDEKTHFDGEPTVAAVAKAAIAKLEAIR
jgi:HEAT repeat protein